MPLVFVRNGNTITNGILYIDNNPVGIASWGNFGSDSTNNVIGIYEQTLSYPFNGLIDDVRVYNRALTEAEIKQLYKAGSSFHPNATNKSTIRDGLVGHWSFDGADMGTTSARDASGNANTGWLINGAKKAIGKIGQGLSFDGSNDNVNVGDINATDGATYLTVSAWGKQNKSGNSPRIISKSDSDGKA